MARCKVQAGATLAQYHCSAETASYGDDDKWLLQHDDDDET